MKTLTPSALALAALIASAAALASNAHADEPYLGLSLATPGEARLQLGPQTSVGNENHPLALKLYAGIKLSDGWSAEIGYGAFGSWHFSDPVPGSSDRAKIATRAWTAAARYSWDLGDRVALFGKVGVALNRLRYSDTLGQTARDRFTRPMWGLGAEWKLSDRLSVPLEFEYLGAAETELGEFRQEKLEIGLRYRF